MVINPYSHVSPYTRTWIAEQRDMLHEQEVRDAARADTLEPSVDKAWRQILAAHEIVRYQIRRMRRAIWAMGKPLSVRGRREIETSIASGWSLFDPHPEVSLTEAAKHLMGNMQSLRERWAALREAEVNEWRKKNAQ